MPDASVPNDAPVTAPAASAAGRGSLLGMRISRVVWIVLLVLAAVLFALHFVHLSADFPNHSQWMDWSKYTDEGWYGDAAIRHYLSGHWYWKGDFNPAVALPVWPALELLVFRFTGVSIVAARALTVCVFGITLIALYLLIARYDTTAGPTKGEPLAAALAVFLLCASPMLYVFERMAILEPLLIALMALAMLAASYARPVRIARRTSEGIFPALSLAVLLPTMVLTKTTAVCLFPAIFYLLWQRAGYRLKTVFWMAVPPVFCGVLLWCAYFFLFVRPRYLEDYRYLFSANAYTGIELEPMYSVVLNTITDGVWIGTGLYLAFFAVFAFVLFGRPKLFRNPLLPAMLLWIGGYFAFLAYHNNLQPRYYTVVAVPITVVVALGLDALLHTTSRRWRAITFAVAAISVLTIAVPGIAEQIGFLLHPTYEFEAAAQGIKRIVLADPKQSHLILSISGSDLTLMTGLPSIDDDFGTLDLDVRVKQYRPGWYAAWNDVEDDKADALTPLYSLERVAAFPAYDDPDRNLLILYRLNPLSQTQPSPGTRRHPRRIRKQLKTNVGQQPSDDQLQH